MGILTAEAVRRRPLTSSHLQRTQRHVTNLLERKFSLDDFEDFALLRTFLNLLAPDEEQTLAGEDEISPAHLEHNGRAAKEK